MIKLDPNTTVITQITPNSQPKPKNNLAHPHHALPLTSINNINTIVSKSFSTRPPPETLIQKNHPIKNRQQSKSIPRLDYKVNIYKEYLHYVNNPTDCHSMLLKLETPLLHQEIKDTQHTEIINKLLPLLTHMADSLLTLDNRKTLTPSQLTEVNLRENVIRKLIAAAALLPAILLSIDRPQYAKYALSIRNTLSNELIQGALCRLTHAQPSSETEMRALLHAPTPALYEKLEHVITNSQTTLLKPAHKKCLKHIQVIEQAAADARRFLNSSPVASSPFPPLSTDTLYAIRTVAKHLAALARQLKPRIPPDIENTKIPKKYHTWLSPHGMEPAVPAAHLAHTLHRGLNKTASALEKLHQHINRERLSPFPATTLKSFLSLSHDDRMQCLILKKMAIPVQDNADKLQRAAADLHNAIRTALPQNGYPPFLPATPEAALRVELDVLTEETPHTTLLLAAKAAHTASQQILNTSSPCLTPAPAYAKFSAVVQEYSDELRRAAHLLKHAVHLTEINFRQKSILTALQRAEKTAHDIKHILNNALESVSGVALSSRAPWLRKLDIDLHTHWQGITALSEKGRNNYILCGQQGMAPAAWIQYAVLPLLNEAEKLRGACRSLEMVVSSPDNRDAAEKTADAIKNNALTGIIQAEHTIHDMLSEKNKAVYLCYKNEAPTSVSLKHLLHTEVRSLLNTGLKLQEIAWLLSWNAEDIAVRQSLVHIRGSLRASKKRIKDAVETATGVRPHINSPEGMIAKDAAEWLMELKNPPEGGSQDDTITALIDRLCEEFTSEQDPKGTLFRLRITLAMRDAEQGNLIWPLTPQEQLNTVKTPKEYTLAWGEKRLTYSMLYNCLVQYTPAALFSLSRVKNTLVSPLRLINLLLTPVRMTITREAMQKVRPGSPEPTELIAKYTAREVYQAVFRAVSLLSPQLFKTVAATGVTTYGLIQGGEYRHAFLNRAAARLPGDLFWVGGFAAWHQAVTVFHALRQQETLSPEQVKYLQRRLNLNPIYKENVDSSQQPAISGRIRHTRAVTDNVAYENNNKTRSVADLMQKTELNACAKDKDIDTTSDQELVFNNSIETQLDKNLAFIQSYYHNKELQNTWKHETSLDWWFYETERETIWREEYTNNPAKIILKNNSGNKINVIQINNRWYLNDWEPQRAYLYATLCGLDTLPKRTQNTLEVILYRIFKAHPETSPEEAIKIANTLFTVCMLQNKSYAHDLFKMKYALMLAIPDKIDGFIDNEQRKILHTLNISMQLDALQEKELDRNLAFIKPYYLSSNPSKYRINGETSFDWWQATKKGTCNWTKGDATAIHITQVNDNWYLNDWKQQKAYLYATLNGLDTLSEPCKNILDAILYRIFKTNPEVSPDDAVNITNATLSILMFQNIHNALYVNNIFQIKYALMHVLPHRSRQFVDDIHREILYRLHIPVDLAGLEKTRSLLDPTAIDTEKYLTAFIKYRRIPLKGSVDDLDNHDLYYKGIAACTQFLQFNPINQQNHQDVVDKACRYFIQQQLMLLNKTIMTQKEKDKLIWLNIAKYHFYSSFQICQEATTKEKTEVILPEIILEKREAHAATSSSHVTSRLLELSKNWEDRSATSWKDEEEGIEGNLYSISAQKYIYLRGLLWKIFEFSENHIAILAEKKDGQDVILEAISVNNVWDIAHADSPRISGSLDLNLALIKFYIRKNELQKTMPGTTSLHWWLDNTWEHTEPTISKEKSLALNNTIMIIDNKRYLHIYPYYWEYKGEEGNSAKGILTNRLGATLNVQLNNDDGQWYLNSWTQQHAYFYSTLNGLETLSQDSRNILDDIVERIFKTNPETSLEHVIKIANITLSMLLFQRIHDKSYVNDILQIKCLLRIMSGTSDITEPFIDIEQIGVLHELNINIDFDALKKNLSLLYPTEIDNKKYITALTKYYAGNIDNNDAYYKGIDYCNNLTTNLKNENNQLVFNQILFHLTKKELTTPATEAGKEELAWLDIAKYHLYSSSRYLSLQESITEYYDKIPSSADNNTFSILKKSKIDAVKIYYLNQENLNASQITLNEEEILREYSNIIALKNEVSDCLEMITAALFYQIRTQEKLNGFDFIKAKVYYKQQMEQFTTALYTFNAVPPLNFISHQNFKPSKDFSSQREYTKQFNDYIDNGSSDYESKLLSSLLLEQLDINLEDLSLPPKRWFTFELICYEYSEPYRGIKHEETVKKWPGELNVIQLSSGDYISISGVNGNMKTNIIKKENYDHHMKENFQKDIYFNDTNEFSFFQTIIGSLPPTTKLYREAELKFCEEKKSPLLVKTAVQQALHASLNVLAEYQKKELENIRLTQNILETFVPFYKEFYRTFTDSHYISDKTSLFIDSIFVIPILKSIGVSLKSLGKTESISVINTVKEGIHKKLSQTELSEFVSRRIPQIHIDKSSLVKNKLAQLIESIPVKTPPLEIVRKGDALVEILDIRTNLPLSVRIHYPVPLKEPGEFGYHKGIYTVPPSQVGDKTRYFIKNGEEVYQVHWDKNKYTWRLIENEHSMRALYGIPIRYLTLNKWEYNSTLRLRGGGIKTQEILTETKETVVEFNASSHSVKTDAVPSNDNIFISKNILIDPTAISEITKAIKKAKITAIEILEDAKIALNDKILSPRISELLRIFTNKRNEQEFIMLLRRLKKALKHLNVENDIKLVNVEHSELFSQISPYHYSAEEAQYLSINYSTYQKNKELIFTEEVTKEKKEYYANENFARTLIHEFTHAKSVAGSTDSAGYIELLTLNGKHDVTKLLIQAKMGLPQVMNNADSLVETILILSRTGQDEFYIDSFLEKYQLWEEDIEKRISQLKNHVESMVADKLNLSWTSTVKSEIRQLKEEYNLEMCKQLISKIDKSYTFLVDI